jgi:hypothetical protein
LYLELLARAIDKERVGEAHPAFPKIIEALSPDEILLLRMIRGQNGAGCKKFESEPRSGSLLLGKGELRIELPRQQHRQLAHPKSVLAYFEHLVSLNVLQWLRRQMLRGGFFQGVSGDWYETRFTHFGLLFMEACLPERRGRKSVSESPADVAGLDSSTTEKLPPRRDEAGSP